MKATQLFFLTLFFSFLGFAKEVQNQFLFEYETLSKIAQAAGVSIKDVQIVPAKKEGGFYSPYKNTLSFKCELAAPHCRVLFSHELTHAVFEKYMSKENPRWSALRKQFADLRDKQQTLLDGYSDVNISFIKMLEIEGQLAKLQTKLDEVRSKNLFLQAYHEFIADSLAVLIEKDLGAVQKGVGFLPNELKVPLLRDFTAPLSLVDEEVWRAEINKGRKYIMHNPYVVLAPLRGQVSELYRRQIDNQVPLEILAVKLFSALKNHFESQDDIMRSPGKKPDPVEFNASLYRFIKSSL